MLITRLFDPVFEIYVDILTECTDVEADMWLSEKCHCSPTPTSEIQPRYAWMSYHNEAMVLWFDLSKLRIDTIAHECLHIAMQVAKHIDIPISFKNDEFLTYYQGYWMRQVLAHLNISNSQPRA